MPDSPAITTQRIPPFRTASQSSVDACELLLPPDERQRLRSRRFARRGRGADGDSRRAAQERQICGLRLLRRTHSQLLVEPAPALLVDSEGLAAAAECVVRGHQRSGCDLVERIDVERRLGPGHGSSGRARPERGLGRDVQRAPSLSANPVLPPLCPRRSGRGEERESETIERPARQVLGLFPRARRRCTARRRRSRGTRPRCRLRPRRRDRARRARRVTSRWSAPRRPPP